MNGIHKDAQEQMMIKCWNNCNLMVGNNGNIQLDIHNNIIVFQKNIWKIYKKYKYIIM